MNDYVNQINAFRNQEKHDPKDIKDQWQTPDWLFYAINALYGPCLLDLFTDAENAKCEYYYTAEDNALVQNWGETLETARYEAIANAEIGGCLDDSLYPENGVYYFANPPYSRSKYSGKGKKRLPITGMSHIMKKAVEEHSNGVGGIWLLKTATAEAWWPDEHASQIIHIKGRVSFDPPRWFRNINPDSKLCSAGFGASIVIFNGKDRLQARERYITIEELKKIGEPIAKLNARRKAERLKLFDDL